MESLQRRVGLILLLVFLLGPALVSAQDGSTVRIVGSGVVTPLLEALAQESGAEIALNATVTGTTDGIAGFCAGEFDAVATSRPLSTDEDAACTNNNVVFSELLLGHNILAFVTQPGLTFAECLDAGDLKTLLAPSSQDTVTNWNQVNSENPDTPLALIVPRSDTPIFLILDRLVAGDGIRADAIAKDSDADIIAAVQETPGSVGVVALNSAQAAGDSVKVLSLDSGEAAGCVAPSAENVEGRLYSGATRLFLYVKTSSLENTGLKALLEFVTGPESAPVIESMGFTAPSPDAVEKNRLALEDTQGGRQFSQEVVSFQIPEALAGAVNIAGSASVQDLMEAVTNSFTSRYAGVTITYEIEGEPAGWRRFCNGEMDLLLAHADMPPDQAETCAANNIENETFALGSQAIVLVGNAGTDFLSCLTGQQLASAWGATSTGQVTTWNQVDAKFPELKMTLFGPRAGDSYSDLLMTRAAGINSLARDDIEVNSDPLYRAAATANVEGALTYMTWADYERVQANNQANIQLVAVDSGNGCVLPDPDTIVNASYNLVRPARLVVSRVALARIEVQSLLWFLFSDENFSLWDSRGIVGLTFGDLPPVREDLERAFTLATEEAAARAAAEATAEPTAEATPESTSEPGVEGTPESTPEAGG